MPRPAQNPVPAEAVNLRRRRYVCESAGAEQRADRRDGDNGADPPVAEVGQRPADRRVLPAVGAEVRVPGAVAGAMPDEQARVRPAADQRKHGVAAGRVPDGADPARVDAHAEYGIAEQPVQHRAQLARTAAPVGCGAGEPAVAPAVAGMVRGRHDVAGLCEPDRRAAMAETMSAGAVGDQDESEAPVGERRVACRRHGERPLDGPSGRRAGRIPERR